MSIKTIIIFSAFQKNVAYRIVLDNEKDQNIIAQYIT